MREYLDYSGLATLVSETRDHVKSWIGVDETSGSSTKYLNEQGEFSGVTIEPAVPGGPIGSVSYTTIELDEISSS
jgi:hypothetical protein